MREKLIKNIETNEKNLESITKKLINLNFQKEQLEQRIKNQKHNLSNLKETQV